jgi:hypothetical protein
MPTEENPSWSAWRAQSSTSAPSTPGIVAGNPMPISIATSGSYRATL